MKNWQTQGQADRITSGKEKLKGWRKSQGNEGSGKKGRKKNKNNI